MNIETEIAALLAEADKLRPLPDDEPAKVPLTAIVDKINKLRAVQAKDTSQAPKATVEGADPAADQVEAVSKKRK